MRKSGSRHLFGTTRRWLHDAETRACWRNASRIGIADFRRLPVGSAEDSLLISKAYQEHCAMLRPECQR